jgi:hypothetical protein
VERRRARLAQGAGRPVDASDRRAFAIVALTTGSERLGNETDAAQVRHPGVQQQPWLARSKPCASPAAASPTASFARASRLYDRLSGLPWVPGAYTLIAPNGDRYELDGQGRIERIAFADGAQWLLSDAGVAAIERRRPARPSASNSRATATGG